MPSYTILFILVFAAAVRGVNIETLVDEDDCPPVTCQCGNDTFARDPSKAVNQRCCIPSTCESPGVCPQGHVIPVSGFCENQNNPSVRCYNSYNESDTIGDQRHFACSDKCVPVLDMCQGIDWCTAEIN